jgi:alanine dehydrogenase
MNIGVPKEIKDHESRVAMTPAGVRELVAHGHAVTVETRAGIGSGFDDQAYRDAGATIAPDADAVFEAATLIVKVKEPQPVECKRLRPHHVLFT